MRESLYNDSNVKKLSASDLENYAHRGGYSRFSLMNTDDIPQVHANM